MHPDTGPDPCLRRSPQHRELCPDRRPAEAMNRSRKRPYPAARAKAARGIGPRQRFLRERSPNQETPMEISSLMAPLVLDSLQIYLMKGFRRSTMSRNLMITIL